MTSKFLQLSFQGLITAMGNLQSPTGGLATAQNMLFPAPGLAEKRKGVKRTEQSFGGPTWEVKDPGFPPVEDGSVFFQGGSGGSGAPDYGSPEFLLYGNGVNAWSQIETTKHDPSSTQLSLRASPHLPYRMRMAHLNGTYFFTGYDGAVRIPVGAVAPATPYLAQFGGAPKAPGFDTDRATGVLDTATPGFLLDGNTCAYRCVIGFYVNGDRNAEVLGAPSGRSIVSNIAATPGYTGAPANVIRRVLLPPQVRTFGFQGGADRYLTDENLTTDFFIRVFRSTQVDWATQIPSDELKMCLEYRLTATDITNGYVEFSTAGVPAYPDSCPDVVRGADLYTNSQIGGDGGTTTIVGSTVVGLAAANDPPPQAWEVAEFSGSLFFGNIKRPARRVMSLVGLPANGDVLSIDGQSYTATNAFPPASGSFFIVTGGSLSENIAATANNLVECINEYTKNEAVIATYTGNNSSPGTVGQFVLEARAIPWSFALNVSSDAFGQTFLPSMLAAETVTVDPESQTNGIAISKPRQGDAFPPTNYTSVGPSTCTILAMVPLREALFIFTDVGIYWCRSTFPSFSFELFDPTFRLWGARGAVNVGDAIYAWGREGIAQITSGGVRHLDVPIRNLVQQIESRLGFDDVVRHTAKIADYFAIGYRTARRVMFFYPGKPDTMNCREALVWNIATETWSTWYFSGEGTKSAAAVRTLDELAFYGNWNPGSSDSWLFLDRNAGTQADYGDQDNSGAATTIESTIEWNNQAPDPTTLMRWQELTLYMSPNQVNSNLSALASSLSLQFSTEVAGPSVTGLQIISVSARQLVPRDVALGVRMGVSLNHSEFEQYFAFCGASLLYTPLSTGATK